MIERNEERYSTLLRLVGSLSKLFSENKAPYVDSRFVERLFVVTTNSIDLGREDRSFDARLGDVGVGVKTFLASTGNRKREKVAEFTKLAREGHFLGLDKEAIVRKVVAARNERVLSDANEIGIDISKSYYHCLVRLPGGAIVHEEPYGTIDESSLKPTNSSGKVVKNWNKMGKGIYFTDGMNNYTFNAPKSVLMREFIFDRKKNFIPIEIHSNPLEHLEGIGGSASLKNENLLVGLLDKDHETLVPGKDYVVLPLYSTRNEIPEVPKKSGINQWNSKSRGRKLGEVYVPIPADVHRVAPGFFPERQIPFDLKLPNRSDLVSAKVCQDRDKALMTNPNHILGTWLIGVLYPSIDLGQFEVSPDGYEAITYDDLLRIEKDSVRVVRQLNNGVYEYSIEFSAVGSYEEFLEDAAMSIEAENTQIPKNGPAY
jgi:hypothetical protein